MHSPPYGRTESKNQQDRLATRRDQLVVCANCGRGVARKSRHQIFCSARCRQHAAYCENVRRGAFAGGVSTDTALPTKPPKKPNGFNGLQRAKSGSTGRICGPAGVIEQEVFARWNWRAVTSADGVAVEVAIVR